MSELREAIKRNPHLERYLVEFKRKYGKSPDFKVAVSRDLKELKYPNIIYPVGDPIFIHIFGSRKEKRRYIAIEPRIRTIEEKRKYDAVLSRILEKAPFKEPPETREEFKRILNELFRESIRIQAEKNFFSRIREVLSGKLTLNPLEAKKFGYLIERDILGTGALEPLVRDPYIEDIHVIGPKNVFVVHKIFETIETNIDFGDEVDLILYLKNLGERIGRPVSEGSPIVDGSLPDGSRINIVFSREVSRKGPSFTIRKFSETPISITQLVQWGTLSSQEAAYLWICLEYGMSIFVCGETASGKTTTLNAMLPFIKPESKIFTAEDTPEVLPPHEIWQQLITRERGPEEGRVTLFDLLRAGLRSRPNYIIVGEIRGVEGAVAFQAMQTGHPVLATFHAASVRKMIQRFTGEPINVPITFIDNLNVALIQQAVYRHGKFLRRCTSVEEIEGYYEELGGVATRTVFEWDAAGDVHVFRGLNNSYVLETKIAERAGYKDTREIYNELELRARIIEEMIAQEILNYHDVVKTIRAFYEKGLEGLPFKL